jgi:serpin B
MSDNADNPDSFCLCLCPEEAEMLDATVERLRIMRFLQVVALLSAAPIFAAEPSTSTAATAINALGIDLLRKASDPDSNALLSPYSMQSALAMAFAGSDGATRAEMSKVLHFPKDDAEVHRSFAAMREALGRVVQESVTNAALMKQHGATNDPITLTVANRLFGQTGYEFRTPFLALVNDSYAAPFEALDFAGNPSGAAGHINVWVEEQTQRRIRNLIPDDALDKLTRLVLVNAIYLKAPWDGPFQTSATKPGSFHLNSGKSVDVPMMTQTRELPYAKGDGFSVVQLSYGGDQLGFFVLLPEKPRGLASLEAKLTPGVLTGKALKWAMREVTLYMPRFKLEPPMLPLSKKLQVLGINGAFDRPLHSANFDRIAPRRPNDYLYISEVFHKTFLNVDEQGTEAAAATAIHGATMGIHETPKPIEVRVDHPFLFAIQHRSSGACLFLGRVCDPR